MNTNTIDGRTQSVEIDATVTCQPTYRHSPALTGLAAK